MKKRAKSIRQALSFEQLESRIALAGEVLIKASKGSLTITGDA